MRDRKRIDPGGREGEEDLGGVEGAIFNKREKSLPTQKILRQFYPKKKVLILKQLKPQRQKYG